MNTIQKIKNFTCSLLKIFFFNLIPTNIRAKETGEPDCFNTGAEENCSLNFEEYREAYITRCRWS
jgi:hypothetical protein